jgi:hypothetical protein
VGEVVGVIQDPYDRLKGIAMSELTESEIKAAISALDEKRRRDPRVDKKEAYQKTYPRDAEKFLKSYLEKTGFEFHAFERIHAQAQTEIRRLADEQKAADIKQSSAVREDLLHSIDHRRTTIERLKEGGFSTAFAVVDTPFIIWPTNDLQLIDAQIEPWKSSAKITGLWSGEIGVENLWFIFVWQNPSEKFLVVHVGSSLALNGRGDAFSESGFDFGSINDVSMNAVLNLWECGTNRLL